MGVVAVLMLGFFAFLVMRASSPQLAPLYSGLSLEDSSAIVRELQTMGTPYELRGDGETIMIPRDQITTVRMNLAGNGLPARGQVGYEIFDQQNTLGATSFVQNINNVRALEGELARTISSLARIKSARVHLVLPERELFRRERKDPTASIVVSVRGELSNGEIRAIQHLMGSAIEGLNPNKVSIIDDSGRLLASGAVDGETLLDSARGVRLAPERRRVGYVPQDAGLFPHLTAEQNVRFAARRDERRVANGRQVDEEGTVGKLCDQRSGRRQPDACLADATRAGDGYQASCWLAQQRYERMGSAFHARLRDGFRAIAREEPERCVVIDAARGINAVAVDVRAAVAKRYGLAL